MYPAKKNLFRGRMTTRKLSFVLNGNEDGISRILQRKTYLRQESHYENNVFHKMGALEMITVGSCKTNLFRGRITQINIGFLFNRYVIYEIDNMIIYFDTFRVRSCDT